MVENNKGIFISYRNDESTRYGARVEDSFKKHFGPDRVFRRTSYTTLQRLGLRDFRADADMERAVDSSKVLIAVIDRNWLTGMDAASVWSLNNANAQLVRGEIVAAFKRNILVVPVLVQGASMPRRDELPVDLAPLARRDAFELHDSNWRADIRTLINAVDKLVKQEEQTQQKEIPWRTSTSARTMWTTHAPQPKQKCPENARHPSPRNNLHLIQSEGLG